MFDGNVADTPGAQVKVFLPAPSSRDGCVKIVVVTHENHPSLRVAVLGRSVEIVVKTSTADGSMKRTIVNFGTSFENLMTCCIKPAYSAGVHGAHLD